ncbi:MAG: hypothetical protein J6Z29_03255 [Ruminococcus sp.]|nr:hypothetical protein [Ruminococcus sp.]
MEDNVKEEFETYGIADLEQIINEQRDLYSEEDIETAKEVLARKRKDAAAGISQTEALLTKDNDVLCTLLCICILLNPLCGIIALIGVGVKGSSKSKKYIKPMIGATVVSITLAVFLFFGGFMSFLK